MKKVIHKMRTNETIRAFFVVFLCSFFIFQAYPTRAEEPHVEMVWVLTETQVNPYDGRKEFIGGGAQPDWFSEARFEGTFVRYSVTETSFRIDDRWVDHGYEHHNVTIETYFEKPPLKLTPGEMVELTYGFSHGGTAEDGGTRVQFWYDSEDVAIQPNTVFAYAPWAEDFDGKTDGTYSFKVPPASSGSAIEIWASWWNAEPCLVVWKYQAQEASGTAEEIVPDQIEEPVPDMPIPEVGQGRELGEAECARLQQEVADKIDNARGANESNLKLGIIGVVRGQYGGTVHDYCVGGEGPLQRGGLIKIGDCIRTGPNGRLRIQMNDRDDKRNAGPSVLNIGTNSEVCFDKFFINFDDPPEQETTLSVIKGAIRVIFKGWRGKSSFKVRAGVSICGIRGTEVFISYSSSNDLFYTQVLEGHMDVTIEATGETVSLTDNQNLVVSEGEIAYTGEITQEDWDANLEETGLRDEGFPDSDIIEWEMIVKDSPAAYDIQDENTYEPVPVAQSSQINLVLILISVLLCLVILVAIIIGIVFLVRKRAKP